MLGMCLMHNVNILNIRDEWVQHYLYLYLYLLTIDENYPIAKVKIKYPCKSL